MPAIVFYIVNLPAPTDGRATRNERSSGAFGIPELKSPAAMDFHSNPERKLSVADNLECVCAFGGEREELLFPGTVPED